MHVILTELGYEPFIVTTNHLNVNISFLNRTTNIVEIQNYTNIKENEYDILVVNSDQTWRRWDNFFYDYGFLKFAKNWNKLKFVYGASLGYDFWSFNETEENIIKPLISNFSDVSVRERGSIKFPSNIYFFHYFNYYLLFSQKWINLLYMMKYNRTTF